MRAQSKHELLLTARRATFKLAEARDAERTEVSRGRAGSTQNPSLYHVDVLGMQVRASVASAVAPLTEREGEVLAEVREMLAPARDATWPSGRPENN